MINLEFNSFINLNSLVELNYFMKHFIRSINLMIINYIKYFMYSF